MRDIPCPLLCCPQSRLAIGIAARAGIRQIHFSEAVSSMNTSAARTTGIHPLLAQAVSLHQSGCLDGAAKLYQAILDDMPDQFDAAHLLGVIALQEGRYEDAQTRIGSALTIDPKNGPALSNLATAYLRGHRFDDALKFALRAAEVQPEAVDAQMNLGMILRQLERFKDSLAPLEKALNLSPNSTVIRNLLGASLLDSGDASRAAQMFDTAAQINPDDGDSWANLSAALNALSQHERALQCASKALALRGNSAAALSAQATSQFELGKIEESVATYRSAMALSPSLQTLCSFANALIISGLNDEALQVLQRAIDMDGSDPVPRWAQVFAEIKPVYASAADVILSRERFSHRLAEFRSWVANNPHAEAHKAVGTVQPFFLAYHPFNNKALLARYGELSVECMKSLQDPLVSAAQRPKTAQKMRIGIASAYIREHSVWYAIVKGWVEHFDRKRFEVYLFPLSPIVDVETKNAKRLADHVESRPTNLLDWIAAIREANLDALIYPDMGMDKLTAQLASLRLVSVQAASWGHAETTGIPTIDLYLSGEALEPTDAQDNYSERLVRLPNLGVYVDPLRPKTLDPDLNGLGLPKKEPLLLCAGAPFKYSPCHDGVWLDIARGLQKLGSGRLVFFSSSAGSLSLMLINRLRNTFDAAKVDFDSRVCVVPLLDRARFFGLMERAALMLDTIGFSGFNTALQGIECGLPVLTCEGDFMRSRLASCLMRRMDLPELIATTQAGFVERAVALTADKTKLKKLRAEIIKRRPILFSDLAPVRQLEEVLYQEISSRNKVTAA
jgi:protein O-GlcNAc transferase